jgi:transcription initiation factor TFIIIB Brf1 subunit/transcription initiation factor TFIIB
MSTTTDRNLDKIFAKLIDYSPTCSSCQSSLIYEIEADTVCFNCGTCQIGQVISLEAEYRVFADDDNKESDKEHYFEKKSYGNVLVDEIINSKPSTFIQSTSKTNQFLSAQRLCDQQTDTAYLKRRREYLSNIKNLCDAASLPQEVLILAQEIFVEVSKSLKKMHDCTRIPLLTASVHKAALIRGVPRTVDEMINCINSLNTKFVVDRKSFQKASKLIAKEWHPQNAELLVDVSISKNNADYARRVCNHLQLSARLTEHCARECEALTEMHQCTGKTPKVITTCAIYRVLTAMNQQFKEEDLLSCCGVSKSTISARLSELSLVPVAK